MVDFSLMNKQHPSTFQSELAAALKGETLFDEVSRLLYSTDPDIASLADWYNRCGPSALQDLQTNFGINTRFFTGLE